MLKKFIANMSVGVRAIIAIILAAVLLISVVLGAGAISSCVSDKIKSRPVDYNWKGVKAEQITDGYEKGTAFAPQTSTYDRVLDPSEIVRPVAGVVDEHETYGVKAYPSYGKNLSGYTVAERDGLIRESHALAPSPTWKSLGIYNAIDAEGYLLKNGQRVKYSSSVTDPGGDDEEEEGGIISGGLEDEEGETPPETGSTTVNKQYNQEYRKLYKHTASLTHFGGGLSDDEPRIVKTITAVTHTKLESTQLTGLYAPAGEVIKFQMSKTDYYAAGGLRVLIGQNYNLWQHVSMETAGAGIKGTGLNRMPDILSIFQYNDANGAVYIDGDTVTFYVGSFFGGPIYFRSININTSRKISVTISGGVRYQHFILGATTKEEYEENKKSTAPYFDLEVYDSVRFTTTKHTGSGGLYLRDYTYENCTDAAVLWDKIAEVSTRVAANGLSGASAPVYIIGDCYIAAGAAFANPGRNGVVCPPSWLAEALNYNTFVNGGCWGTMHEYNHCWQGYGFGNGGEVTNNATTLISYSLYTRISAGRTSDVGWGGGWNRFTDPSRALGELLSLSSGEGKGKSFDLSVYASLLHNIGQDNFIEAARGGREAASDVYYKKLVDATHYDMTYFVTDVLNYTVSDTAAKGNITQAAIDEVKANKYPVFVPVSSVYQVGRSIVYLNEKGKKETQYITTAQPFSYGHGEFIMDFNDKNNFANGSFASKSLVIPDGFTVKVTGVTQPENGKVKLLKDNKVQYTPKNGTDGLYSGNFSVKLKITKDDKAFAVDDVELVINLKQSSVDNTLNRTTYVYDDASQVPDTASVLNAKNTSFNFGKYSSTETKPNVCTQETNTQIWQSGWNYDDEVYNKDSKNYREMPLNQTLQTMDGVMYFSSKGTYRFTLKGRGKATLYLSYDNGATWVNAVTIDRTSGNAYDKSVYLEHNFDTDKNYVRFKVVHLVTKVNDFFGVGTAKQNADGTFPNYTNASAITSEGIDLHKAIQEEASKKFTTEYRYKNEYKYSYSYSDKVYASGTTPLSVSHEPWDNGQPITNMFDGNSNTYYHSKGGAENYITEEKPFELVVDFGELRKVNSVTFNGYKGNVGNNGMVKTFKLYGSKDNKKYTLLTEQVDAPADKKNVTFEFDAAEIRYYKLVVTKTDNGRYFAMNSIVFSFSQSFAGGHLVAPHDFNVRYDKAKKSEGWTTQNLLCTYGIIYEANAKDSVEFHFTGTRFAYLAYKSADYGTVDIYIDGKKVASDVSLSGDGNSNAQITEAFYNYFGESNIPKVSSAAYMYTGAALKQGDHVVKIVGKSGKFNVDSFAYWD